jgi:hypothetical protein
VRYFSWILGNEIEFRPRILHIKKVSLGPFDIAKKSDIVAHSIEFYAYRKQTASDPKLIICLTVKYKIFSLNFVYF